MSSLRCISVVIFCTSLSPIVNGMIVYSPDVTSPYDFGTAATYSCNDGFYLDGEQSRNCAGDGTNTIGTWDLTAPICTGMQPFENRISK